MCEAPAQELGGGAGVTGGVIDAIDHDHLVGHAAAGPICISSRCGHDVFEWVAAVERHQHIPQLRSRGYFETPLHPVLGAMPLASLPFQYASVDGWLRAPAPTLGQHNETVLSGILGLSADELRELEAEGVIGTRPEGL